MRRGSWERLGLAKVYLGLEGIEEGYARHYDILLGQATQRSGGLVATSRFLSQHLTRKELLVQKYTTSPTNLWLYNSLFGLLVTVGMLC